MMRFFELESRKGWLKQVGKLFYFTAENAPYYQVLLFKTISYPSYRFDILPGDAQF